MRSTHLLTTLGALVLAAPLALAASPTASADAAPVLSVSIAPGATLPIKVPDADSDPLPPGACDGVDCEDDADVFATVKPSATAQHVTVTVSDHDGLRVDPEQQQLGTVTPSSPNAGYAPFTVSAQTPGFHQMTLTVTADGAEPVSVTMPYLWFPGGAPLAGTDNLFDRQYGYQGTDYYHCGESDCEYRVAKTVSFLQGHRARFSLAAEGHDVCGSGQTCSGYEYDASTGLFQIGARSIGKVTDGAYLDNTRYFRMVYPAVGRRLAGTWRYRLPRGDEARGVGDERLSLTKNGTFDLRFSATRGGRFSSHLHGTYRIGRHGKLVLTDPRKHVTRAETLALLATEDGSPRAMQRGVWLDLQINPRKGKDYQDGNRLLPVS